MWTPSAIPNRDPTTERRKKGQRRRASLLNLIVKAGLFDTHRDYVALRSGNEQGVRVCDTHPLLIPTPGRTEARLLRPGQRPANIAPPSLSPAGSDWRRSAPSAPSSPSPARELDWRRPAPSAPSSPSAREHDWQRPAPSAPSSLSPAGSDWRRPAPSAPSSPSARELDWRRPAPSAPSSLSRDGSERWARGSATRPPLTPIS